MSREKKIVCQGIPSPTWTICATTSEMHLDLSTIDAIHLIEFPYLLSLSKGAEGRFESFTEDSLGLLCSQAGLGEMPASCVPK